MILAIRTDQPEAELYLLKNGKIIAEIKWPAHRELADTILEKIESLLITANAKQPSLEGIVVFTGEGSFTGLRIGTTVANAIAYSNNIPIVAASGADWLEDGVKNLKNAEPGKLVAPVYHSEPNITKSKKLSLEERSK